ncbi:MAG: NAD(P)/FAD-dependent oxidoreductase [Candidatus Woesearchaeota archaeon]
MRIAIVGAGPSGSYAGFLLAKAGHDVTIFEDHDKIGEPIACTGIVTKALFDLIEYSKDYVINELEGVDIVGPRNEKLHISLKEFVLCRKKFDNHLAEKARKAGAKILLGHRYIGRNGNKLFFRFNNQTVEENCDILIGADGPLSKVAETSGLGKNKKFYVGQQATIQAEYNPGVFTVWFGSIAPGFFAWSVPESRELSRVGVATTNDKNCAECFQRLMKMAGGKIVARQAAPIPIYEHRRRVQNGNTFLVGDAGGFVKDTTGGGIITGMLSAKAVAESIITGTSYEENLRKLRKELWLHSKLRRILNRFSDDDYCRLISLMSNRRIKSILYRYPREYPSRFLLRLLLAEPRLIYFAKYAFA